ncbi:adenosylcobinamide-phosphate synthase CbiB [Pseudodesulfovibrio sp. zrk46]|uniref:adenosylcobinamide-phosphate synthase CbiB n=1 Tax=Pseudodesulfovibrio sp. zrk46 TaxID=2725288 RepID=UPI001449E59C|nr:adenosylcobinamide-phosphate synthase CbiB [Pseudodesulfovibrio sp. zrk46]QJB57684.1 cobalamin biosynthesis protein CobD [Pseudodesulfovibrio sp. zrk46]
MDSFALVFGVPIVAVILDSILGDPQHFPHPVRLIGKTLNMIESMVFKTNINLHAAGWCTMIILSLAAWAIVQLFISIPYIGLLFAIYFAYAGLALGCLVKECQHVVNLLDNGNITTARTSIGMLCSRDTKTMDEDNIRRTLAETLSENLNDGFIAPLFYLILLGPAWLWVYKTVSTMDSMWGYKTDRYRDLGYAAAKTDDILAYIPARLSGVALMLTGKWMGLDITACQKNYANDATKMESPNAGWPMAAAAWIVGGQMGGKTIYFGKVKSKPILGPIGKVWTQKRLNTLLTLCQKTGLGVAGVFILCLVGSSVIRL